MTTPLVPAGVDLRGLPWMRLDTSRLLDSDLFALSTGDEFKAAVALWCKAWSQSPAGSLPADDRVLAHLSGAGARWKRVKAMALRGWIACDDGRLYHPVVAEQVLSAWAERQQYRAEIDAQNQRKQRERAERAAMFEELKAAGHATPWNTPTGKLRDLVRDLSRDQSQTCHGDSHGLDGTGRDGKAKAYSPDTLPERTRDARTPAQVSLVGQFEGHEAGPNAIHAQQEAPQGLRDGGVATPTQTPNPAAPLSVALNRAGFRCTAMNPDLIAYHAAGGTVEHLLAIAEHPDCAGKAATYVIRFARRELPQPAKPTTTHPSPRPTAAAPSRTLQGLAALEALKHGNRTGGPGGLAADRDCDGAAKALPALPRQNSGV